METLIVVLIGGGLVWLLISELQKQQPTDPVLNRISSNLRYRRPRSKSGRSSQPDPVWIAGTIGTLFLIGLLNQVPLHDSGQGTGFGSVDDRNLQNFPPPEQYQQIGGNQSAITYLNGSPDTLQITLMDASGERTVLNFPGCPECKTYSRDNTSQCNQLPGVQRTFSLPPGQYQARAIFLGTHNTKGFKSEWVIAPGWDYHQCVVTLNEMTYY
ncbi:MAG TPA: hypothetical protein V6D29_05870 [Leptolyngbyaceae cyanobacterium]